MSIILILPLLINTTLRSSRVHSQRSYRSPKLTGKRELRNGKEREAVTSNTNYELVQEAYQARMKKPKRKRSSTNSLQNPMAQRSKVVKQFRNAASDDVNGAATV